MVQRGKQSLGSARIGEGPKKCNSHEFVVGLFDCQAMKCPILGSNPAGSTGRKPCNLMLHFCVWNILGMSFLSLADDEFDLMLEGEKNNL